MSRDGSSLGQLPSSECILSSSVPLTQSASGFPTRRRGVPKPPRPRVCSMARCTSARQAAHPRRAVKSGWRLTGQLRVVRCQANGKQADLPGKLLFSSHSSTSALIDPPTRSSRSSGRGRFLPIASPSSPACDVPSLITASDEEAASAPSQTQLIFGGLRFSEGDSPRSLGFKQLLQMGFLPSHLSFRCL